MTIFNLIRTIGLKKCCPCNHRYWETKQHCVNQTCVSAFSGLCHMALPQTHPLWEHWCLVAPWRRLSANLFCAVNNDKRAWALFTSTVQAVIVGSTRSLANVCAGAVHEDEAGWLAVGQASIQNTSMETEQEWKRVSGEELGWAFYHKAIIHSLVNTEEKLLADTLTVLRGHNQSWKKGIL